jgi:anion-transporting  ArsA/GET3 family ATPase
MPAPAAGRPSPTAAEEHDSDWAGVRLHVVTGKGGTGKTTVAAALGIALATGGRRVVVIEVEGRQGLAQLFDVPQLPYQEQRIAVAPGGGEVLGLAVEPKAALLEYLQMFYKLGRAGSVLERIGAVDFATTVAPGVRDVLLTGKVFEAVQRNSRNKGARQYDAVVLDAPPTGRITQFLNVSESVAGLAKVGPIKHQADTMMTLFRSPRTAVHLVTLLEEMPVQETADGIAQLHAARLPVGGIVVNQVRPCDLPDAALTAARAGTLDRAEVEHDLGKAGLDATAPLVEGLLAEAAEHAERRALEDSQRAVVGGLGVPAYELTRLAGGVDLGGLYELAAELTRQGMA